MSPARADPSAPPRDEPRFLAWAAAALPRAFPGLPRLPLAAHRAAWTLAARDIAARLALALAREDLVASAGDRDTLLTYSGPLTVPLRRRGPFGLHQPDLDVPRPAALEHPHALLAALDLGLAPAILARLAHELADSVFHLAMARLVAELRARTRLGGAAWPAPIDPENLVITGHPWHPMCKTRLGLHLHEVLRFAPEALAAARVHAVDLDLRLAHSTDNFAALLSDLLPPAPAGWLRVPVHALQRRRLPQLLPALWGAAIRPTTLPPLPARALLSLRTVAISDLHLKLAADLQTTSARRQVSPKSSRNGPPLGALLQHIITTDPEVRRGLRIQHEPAAAGLSPAALPRELAPHAGQLGAIVRHDLRRPARELAAQADLHDPRVWVCAALGERWPGDPAELPPLDLSQETPQPVPPALSQETPRPVHPYLSQGTPLPRDPTLLHRHAGDPLLRTISAAYPTPEAALRRYVDLLVPPALRLCTVHGVALELHLQNTLVVHERGRLCGFIVRDLGGVRIHRERLAAAGHALDLAPGSFILTDDLHELQTKLAHTLFHAHLAALFTWAGEQLGADERALWAHTRATIDTSLAAWSLARPRLAPACAADRAVLLAPLVAAKALLRMRIDERVSDYAYCQVPSPLAD
ncbi:MAG: hypothetical protein JNK56_15200 [Myxococcales bacterium]|nr:hypothetical protein [Myxococcales bacterium]